MADRQGEETKTMTGATSLWSEPRAVMSGIRRRAAADRSRTSSGVRRKASGSRQLPLFAREELLRLREDPVDLREDPVDLREDPVDLREDPVDLREDPVSALEELSEERAAPVVAEEAGARREEVDRDRLAALRARLDGLVDELHGGGGRERPVFSSGVAALDRQLPAGGLRSGSLVEWREVVSGGGAAQLSWWCAAALARQRTGRIAVVECTGNRSSGGLFYPPAAIAWGVPAERLMVVRTAQAADALWACDQLLRCDSLAAVWWRGDAVEGLDDRAARRLQLAAEVGGGVGLIVCPAAHRRQTSWAEVQWLVHSRAATEGVAQAIGGAGRWGDTGRWWELELRRCWGGRAGERIALHWDARRGLLVDGHDRAVNGGLAQPPALEQGLERPVKQGSKHGHRSTAAAVHLAAQLAHSALAQRTARQRAQQQRRA
jgi:hypothetical protein